MKHKTHITCVEIYDIYAVHILTYAKIYGHICYACMDICYAFMGSLYMLYIYTYTVLVYYTYAIYVARHMRRGPISYMFI